MEEEQIRAEWHALEAAEALSRPESRSEG